MIRISRIKNKLAGLWHKPHFDWRKINLKQIHRKTWLLLAANTLCLAVVLLCLAKYGAYGSMLQSQQVAKQWRGENEQRFAQISCFLPVTGTFDEAGVQSFRQTLDKKLLDAAMEAPENGSLWADGYSAFSKLTVSGERGSSEATAIGVGGDYFLFHPLRLRDGSYLRSDDLMKDRVVIDEELAWKLFGGMEVAGLSITIDSKPYFVAGVIRREDDPLSGKASESSGAYIYVDYSVLAAKELSITCYEVVLPNPVGGFALDTVQNAFPVKDTVFLENSARYQLSKIASLISDFGMRVMRSDTVAFPYWENAARLGESYMALLLVLMTAALLLPVGCILYVLVKQYIKLVRRYQKWRAARREFE